MAGEPLTEPLQPSQGPRSATLAASGAVKARRRLTIQRTFTLIAWVNGAVLIYLLLSFLQLIGEVKGRTNQIYVSLVLVCLLATLTIISNRIITTRIIRPLARLVKESGQIQQDERESLLTIRSQDEVGQLAHSFNLLLDRMRRAVWDADQKTARLRELNAERSDSIRYAALLQSTILPQGRLRDVFGEQHLIFWQPRDLVGGDFYLIHRQGNRCLIGVADCAGHGVSGAMMTMLARAGVDRAIQEVGIDSPARVLADTDAALRHLLQEARSQRGIATSLDMGLVLLDFEARELRFAGARLPLYCSDGQTIRILPGENRSLCERRSGTYHDQTCPLQPSLTYTLSTDGCLDQAGGEHGFSLGSDRFCQWLQGWATAPMAEQQSRLRQALSEFRGRHPQRDDITILSFRCP